MLAATLIFLSALNQSTLYLSRPRNVKEAFICFNSTNSCDNWPENWKRLRFTTINDGELYVMKKELAPWEVNEKYKLRLLYHDQHYENTTEWRTTFASDYSNNINIEILNQLIQKLNTYTQQKLNRLLERCSSVEPVDLMPELKLHLNSIFASFSYSFNTILYFILFFQISMLALIILISIKLVF